MSHSPREAERAWHYGMVDSDWIAFPILSVEESEWNLGSLREGRSLWRERTLTFLHVEGLINLFTVGSLKSITPQQRKPKGVTEGSEIQVKWKARFAPGDGRVIRVENGSLYYRLESKLESLRHFRLASNEEAFLSPEEQFKKNQVLAGQVTPLTGNACHCAGGCTTEKIKQMLASRERTVRFTGCKLAKVTKDTGLADQIQELAEDTAEDPYVRMEAKSYLCEVRGDSADKVFASTLLGDSDDQMRLEAAIALAEIGTQSSFELLCKVLNDHQQPLFLRRACAWGIGCHGTPESGRVLVRAFRDVEPEIRREALVALQDIGTVALDALLEGLQDSSSDIASGAAETLRRIDGLPVEQVAEKLTALLTNSAASTWPTWALANLPKEAVLPHIESLQDEKVRYAVSVLWAFLESWIAEDWTPKSTP
ncbi:MAG: HEAT repeat domain-containing protein [Chloracidobacterium sp.]|nr:HEAT repeat domain-containing protein [Chloracidobacterium validum]